jgi:hypothetical protein
MKHVVKGRHDNATCRTRPYLAHTQLAEWKCALMETEGRSFLHNTAAGNPALQNHTADRRGGPMGILYHLPRNYILALVYLALNKFC